MSVVFALQDTPLEPIPTWTVAHGEAPRHVEPEPDSTWKTSWTVQLALLALTVLIAVFWVGTQVG